MKSIYNIIYKTFKSICLKLAFVVLFFILTSFKTLPVTGYNFHTPKPVITSTLDLSFFNDDDNFKDDSVSCTIPFNKVGNLILIKAKADTLEGNFILDTGAPYLVLNIIYFRNYPVTSVSDEFQTSMSGVAYANQKTRVREFTLGSMSYYQNDVDLIDLGHIENAKGVKILGLIGFKMLSRCEMIIDYEKNLIYMHRIGKKERLKYKSEHLKTDTNYTTLPIDIIDNKIVAQTEIKGRKFKFVLDSGAETNIVDSRLPETFFEQVEITGRMKIRGTGNVVVDALRGNLREMKMGSDDLGNLPILVANLEKTCFNVDHCANGVLGFNFMPLKKLGFNFETRKMYLWK